MPELPEVETVRKALKRQVLGKKIISANVYWQNIIAYPEVKVFEKKIKNQTIKNIERYGKWLMFELSNYYLLSHLRMEGKYFIRDRNSPKEKHEHVIFNFEDGTDLRYNDTRKFGKMYLLNKNEVFDVKPLSKLGLEPWDNNLTTEYLKNKFKRKPIKTELLDQSIIVGIGNIYADEILFMSKINPVTIATELSKTDCQNIIDNTRKILSEAIEKGGTTIKSYTSSEGVHGRFQSHLLVHTKDKCPICQEKIDKITVGGRGTYYCKKCQKERVV
ncbi:MAG: DNA-formamidopyrimidine glycosylase [Bacilli bacterium]|nr:DNA-formamidopyrimidine glycosylase [Bacilli bacterium]